VSASPGERPFKRLSPLTPLVRSFIFVVAVVGTSWRDLLRGNVGPLGWILLALVAAGALYGTASWLRTKYWIEGDELRVDTGVISRQSRRIRVDRLQGVDIVQPFVARLFGLAELKMDVAGGRRSEGSLAFLPLKEAKALRGTLLARRDAARAGVPPVQGAPGAIVGGPAPPPPPAPPAPPERVVARLDLKLLLLSVLLSPETVGFAVSVVVFGGLFAAFGAFAGATGVLPLVGGFALVMFRRVSAFYNFSVVETAAGLQVNRGLFELNTQTITLPRVQGVVLTEPMLWRWMGWARLDVSIAGYHAEDNDKPSATTVMPVGERDLVVGLARHLLDGALGHDTVQQFDAVPLVAPPQRSRWVAPVRRRFMAAGVGVDLVVAREGLLNRRTHVVPHARVQSLRLSQGWWQRRLRLADLHVDSPPGPVHVRARHRDVDEARRLLARESLRSRAARRGR
jgi:putative membrane protein